MRPPRPSRSRTNIHRSRHDEPRRRWWVVAGFAAAVALTCVAVLAPAAPGEPERTQPPQSLPVGFDLLASTARRLRGALLVDERTRLLDTLRDSVPVLTPPLLWTLERPQHKMFVDAALLAADLNVTEAIEPLAAVVEGGSGRARAAALLPLEALWPLDDGTLQTLAAEALEDAPLAAAVLRLVRGRPAPSSAVLDAVLALLRHADAGIRAAAHALLPAELPAACAATLLELTDDAVAGDAALGLLSRVPSTAETARVLVDALAAADADRQQVLLSAIGRCVAAPAVRDQLWEIALGSGADELRAAALSCLERVRDDRPLPSDCAEWPPLLRYHAARLSVAAGRRQGIDLLLLLLGEDDDDAEAVAVAGPVRLCLGRLAQLPPETDAQAFTDWAASLTAVPSFELPPAR